LSNNFNQFCAVPVPAEVARNPGLGIPDEAVVVEKRVGQLLVGRIMTLNLITHAAAQSPHGRKAGLDPDNRTNDPKEVRNSGRQGDYV
jgi:hypothetical protein